jgi:hypothetical protein
MRTLIERIKPNTLCTVMLSGGHKLKALKADESPVDTDDGCYVRFYEFSSAQGAPMKWWSIRVSDIAAIGVEG